MTLMTHLNNEFNHIAGKIKDIEEKISKEDNMFVQDYLNEQHAIFVSIRNHIEDLLGCNNSIQAANALNASKQTYGNPINTAVPVTPDNKVAN